MNRTYLIASGAGLSAASLAVGAVGGYLYAKKKTTRELESELQKVLSREIEKTKKYYEDLIEKQNAPVEFDMVEEESTEPAEEEQEPDPRLASDAKVALTNYQGFAEKPPLEMVAKNVFRDQDKAKKKLPPRDPETGLFVASKPKADFADAPRRPVVQEKREPTPYLITAEEFLANDPEHEQENCLYFVNDKTVIQIYDNTVIETDRIGEVNLTLFPEDSGVERIICVRNEGLGLDYEIQLTEENLTEYLGLSED